VVTVNQEKAIL
jgi:hypothetical protein